MSILFVVLLLFMSILVVVVFGQAWVTVTFYAGIIVVVGMPILLAITKEWFKFWIVIGVYILSVIWLKTVDAYPYLSCFFVPCIFIMLAVGVTAKKN